jgi:hypothetical protein
VVGGINVCFKSRMGCLSEYYPMIHLKLNENGKVNSSVDFNAGGDVGGISTAVKSTLFFLQRLYLVLVIML